MKNRLLSFGNKQTEIYDQEIGLYSLALVWQQIQFIRSISRIIIHSNTLGNKQTHQTRPKSINKHLTLESFLKRY